MAADLFSARCAYGLALASPGEAVLALDDAAAARQAFVEALRLAAEAHLLPVGADALLGIAALHVRAHRPADADAQLAVIGQHPVVDHAVRTRAEALRAAIAARLPTPTRSAAEDRARTGALERCRSHP